MEGIIRAWGKILAGRRPNLSIEITRECPLRCPGCYAYGDEHLGGGQTLRTLADRKGEELIAGILDVVDRLKPLHLSLVGGEPLVRYRELDVVLPRLAERGIYVQVVTSAVRPIPKAWASIRRLQICVSIDGLQREHDARRAPATYDRILKHIDGHRITVHCTVTRQQTARDGYIEEFVRTWSDNVNVRSIWLSLYTPQVDEESPERLLPEDRRRVVETLRMLRERYPKLHMRRGLIDAYLDPPSSPDECIFARTTECISADLKTRITPCQFGGTPDCASCGCMASAGLAAIGRHRLGGVLPIDLLFDSSFKIGRGVNRLRHGATIPPPQPEIT
ncbi:MAG TPA: radical SAM protein [Vicinamibacterales bacterium]|nr:radical SAM protein [Vicinamibacterales bacterium]